MILLAFWSFQNQFYFRDQNKMARKVNEVVWILKDAIAKIEDKNLNLQQPSTSSGPFDISTEYFSDAVERDLK